MNLPEDAPRSFYYVEDLLEDVIRKLREEDRQAGLYPRAKTKRRLRRRASGLPRPIRGDK